ncbi:MAG TPA: ABC transporter permease [bacterium]
MKRGSRLARWWTTLRVSYWLGWQIESNWTDPLLFFIYSIARPLGSALILVFMFFVVARVRQGPILGFFIVGTAFWPFIVNGMQGMAWSIISDREHWRTLRYVYTSPIPYRAYLVGRALAQATSASAAMLITLLFGRWVLKIPMGLATMHLPYALVAFVLGIVAIIALGLVIVSAAMMISGEAWRMPEAVGAALYLLCGAVFPLAVLPRFLQVIAQGIPLTWWLEAMRRGLLGPGALRSFAWATDAQVLLLLAASTAVWLAIGLAIFTAADRRARELGILDRESAF